MQGKTVLSRPMCSIYFFVPIGSYDPTFLSNNTRDYVRIYHGTVQNKTKKIIFQQIKRKNSEI